MSRIWLKITCGGVVATVEGHVCVAILGRDPLGIDLVRVHLAKSWVKMEKLAGNVQTKG